MNRLKGSATTNPGQQVKSFIVRLWQRPEGFTAEARPLTGGENKTFNRLGRVVRVPAGAGRDAATA